jgi:hypothetical protein
MTEPKALTAMKALQSISFSSRRLSRETRTLAFTATDGLA